MSQFRGLAPLSGETTSDWDDWDPDRARKGYTGHIRALRDLDLRRDPLIDLTQSGRITAGH